MKTRRYEFVAESDIRTGDIHMSDEHLVTTGFLGSTRWWFEAMVFSVGGEACDTTASRCVGEAHSVACETFGCTGWARKFSFDVVGVDVTTNEEFRQRSQIKKGNRFRLLFTPMRVMRAEEWALLELTLKAISDIGAVGGKTNYVWPWSTNAEPKMGRIRLVNDSEKDLAARLDLVKEYVRSWPSVPRKRYSIGYRSRMQELIGEWLEGGGS